ncbi:NADH dehydrogenase 1 alpha subcomplex assembly factor 3 [Mrakia frigida]|uniref:Mth938-like domain-containing protein n=1 Tax=Mrakia frigida TaxID=29902 RepID=UPI003FCC1359
MFKPLLSRSLRSTTALLRLPSSSSHLHRPFASSLPKLVQPPPPSYSPDNDFKASTLNTVHIAGVSSAGVELTDGVILPGACILLAGNPFLWNVQLPGEGDEKTWSQFTEDSFRVFEIVGPRPEMLIFGTGPSLMLPPPWIRTYMTSLGIQMDVMPTKAAASLYNMLAEEGRLVAGAFLPLRNVDVRTAKFLPSPTTSKDIAA